MYLEKRETALLTIWRFQGHFDGGYKLKKVKKYF
jgi:hypothetical protein